MELFLFAYSLQPEQYERYPQMHLNLAGVLVDAGRYSEAIVHYGRGLRYAEREEDTLGRHRCTPRWIWRIAPSMDT